MAKKRFITAFSPDASEVAAEVSPSSSAGPIRRRRSPDPPAAAPLRRFEDFPVLPWTRQPTRSYLRVRQRRWGTWVAEIRDRETHTRRWLGSFHTTELATMEYDRWQIRYHDAAARLNLPFGTRPVHLVPPDPGVVSSAMARQDREAWEHLEAEAADEAYMQELRRQHPELVEAERAIFAGVKGGVVIALSSDDGSKAARTVASRAARLSRSPLMTRSKEAATAARRASRWAPRTRRSTSTSGGVPSPTTSAMVLARTQLAAHRT